ncbi:type IV secretory system conjugative DNA transfer family protein [Deinococcus multiflagellatus]|uniref:Type IV secretory system conjugative DNA transfer family protein n=1 Tax=Deinococcus multiflagellatus TaxID=1656887 RepID=A0ABW1ZNW4_9DEIO|nr:type IV secretory system conjugative DNA transfer family protein [Deinococcus multiflagellatus]MBZ9714965.1 type IV secretory system conjugative DNA transfer family protein [Deinococcus multiflagellatus]
MIAWVCTLAALLALSYLVYAAAQVSLAIGQNLLTAPVQTAAGTSTWGQVLGADSAGMAALKCNFQTACATWFGESLNLRFNLQLQVLPMMITFMAMVFAWRQVPDTLIRKDPGQGAWASLEDKQLALLAKVPVKDKKFRAELDKIAKRSPPSLYLGHLIPWIPASNEFLWHSPKLALLGERLRHENVLVTGAPGSGKTRGLFRQNIVLDAHYGRTAIVFDMKWPQMDSGFGDLALYWHRLGRPVYVFAPFSPTSMRMPLLDGINTLDEALKLSRAIIAPPEYKDESGAYYKDNERRALAAMILAIANGPTPNMRELKRLGEMNFEEFTDWYKRQQNPEIRSALKALFDMRPDQIAAMLAGVVNKLSVFYNPEVSRATSAGDNPDEHIDLHKIYREGGLLIVGISSKDIQAGEGEILLQLIKRRSDRALLDVADESPGGHLPITATYYLDELPGLGRLPYLMANLAQLRSKWVCLMLGVQNSDQGGLVYSREYWQALSTNNLGTRVDFIQGSSKEDAKNLSEEIGEYTVDETSINKTGHPMFNTPWSDQARKGEGVKLARRRLLTPEEIKRFPRDLAAVFTKGQNPLLVATPAIDSPTLELMTPDGRVVTVRNELYPLWNRTMSGVQNIEQETKALIASLGIGAKDLTKPEPVLCAPDYWMTWLQELMSSGAMARIQKSDDKLKVMIRRDSLAPELSRERDINYFLGEGWLNVATNEEELTITQAGLNTAGKLLERALQHFVVTGPALYWARTHAAKVKGYPGHDSAAEPDAVYSAELLSISEEVAQQLYGVVPDLPVVTLHGRALIQIPLSDPQALREAIERAIQKADSGEMAPASGSSPATKTKSKPHKKEMGWKKTVAPTTEQRSVEPPAGLAQSSAPTGSEAHSTPNTDSPLPHDPNVNAFLDAYGDD